MPLTKEKKQSIVSDLETKIARQKAMVFMDFTGVKVKDLAELRNQLKEQGSELKVAKKTLLKIALKNKNIELDPKDIPGEIALALGYEDEVAPSKAIYQFVKINKKAKILGGYLMRKFYGAEQIINLAQLPGREQLLGNLVGTINAPISGFVSALHGNLRNLVYALSAIGEKSNNQQ
ncbi:MAG: 50S ribosomal protein L10 [Candidatus Pacebacteria bacterium]|nr:50S ribosomal protein L10 [Candidatus Paceibacterota bacterium]